MLESISLWNIGGIRHAELSFPSGLTVITGESGAGKSSVVRALELAAGSRATAQMIRAGESEGITEAHFRHCSNLRFDGHELDAALQPDPLTGELLARRVLSSKGRSRASLQGIQTPLTTYSLAANRFMHIQSQFAQMELLDLNRQLSMLDSCTLPKIRETALELRQTFDAARELDQERRKLTKRRAVIEQSYANADTVLALVRRVAPFEGLELKLNADLSVITRRIQRREKAQKFLDRLTGGLSEQGMIDDLRRTLESMIEMLPDERDQDSKKDLQQAMLDGLRILGDITVNAQDILGGQKEREADQLEQEQLEARLGALRRLKRLSNTTTEAELLDYCTDAVQNLEWLESSYPLLEDMTRRSNELKIRANALARELRHGRHDAAAMLEKNVNILLADLAMPTTSFEVRFRELDKLRRTGADEIEFSLRDGERVGRVDKIASGGELSRLLLALQLSLPDEWLPPTLVFDEVEAGLGGRAAVLSGLKLKQLSQRCQVLLVTHEASIAALGDFHILVQRVDGETRIRSIDGEERVREIARMLSGSPDMTEAQDHARTLLIQSKE